ncbi:hypothetical protein BDY21DRAFT_215692 [Lineolata rhizophorae]|uniref:Uncharacterized protein n=1 Tax=Lineolata rhizophorae TaxID=578093 RepID=A0A6A6P2H1_9PEZI|nr:hypothetical protein BDY21DRAFT_215692 [Lineolata rhizophorae]
MSSKDCNLVEWSLLRIVFILLNYRRTALSIYSPVARPIPHSQVSTSQSVCYLAISSKH